MRKIGFIDMCSAVASGMLGVSVVTLPAHLHLLSLQGCHTYCAWLVCIPAILSLALLFAQLSTLYPGTGGACGYTEAMYGPTTGRMVGLLYLVMIITENTAVLVVLSTTVTRWLAVFNGHGQVISGCCTAFVTCLCGYSQTLALSTTSRINTGLTVLKLAPLLTMLIVGLPGIFGFWATNFDPSVALEVSTSSISLPLCAMLFAFGGMEFVTLYKTDEIHDPATTIPRSLVWGTVAAGLIYFLLQSLVSAHPTAKTDLLLMNELASALLFTNADKLLLISDALLVWYATAFGITAVSRLSERLEITKYNITFATLAPLLMATLFFWTESLKGIYELMLVTSGTISLTIFAMCAFGYLFTRGINVLGLSNLLSCGLLLYAILSTEGLESTIVSCIVLCIMSLGSYCITMLSAKK